MANGRRVVVSVCVTLAVIAAVWLGVSHKQPTYQLPFATEDIVSITVCKRPSYGGILRKNTMDPKEISTIYQAVNALKFQRRIRAENEPIYQLDGATAYGVCFILKGGNHFFCKGIQSGQGVPESTQSTFTDSNEWSAVVTNLDVLTVFDFLQEETQEITYLEKDRDALLELDWFA